MGPRRSGALAVLWGEGAWPVLAGVLTAVGLVGLAQVCGWPEVGVFFASLALIVSLGAYAAFVDDGVGPVRAGRIGCAASLGVIVVLGLTLLSPRGGWLVAAAILLSSPLASQRLHRLVPSRSRKAGVASVESALEQAAVDAAFDKIVSDLGQESWGDGPEAG